MAVAAVSSVLNLQFVQLARKSLFQGDTATAVDLAGAALKRTLPAKDNDLSAQALFLLGRAHVARSEMKLGYQYSFSAARLFKSLGNPNGHVESLALVTNAATAMCLPEIDQVTSDVHKALDAGGINQRVTGMAYNYLGVSALWNGRYKECGFALLLAHDCAEARGDADFHPRINLFLLEILRVIEWERVANGPVDYSSLVGMSSVCNRAMRKWYSAPIGRDFRDIGMLLLDFANAFTAVRLGEMPRAHEHYQECVLRLIPMPTHSWLVAMALWAKAEVLRGMGDLQGAAAAFSSMRHAASIGQHAPLERIAQDLRSDIQRALVP